jgi:uncharacterized protein (DUF433 family)
LEFAPVIVLLLGFEDGFMFEEVKWSPKPYKKYKWIVQDEELLGGRLAVRGTRFSVSFLLSCFANGMTNEDIDADYAPFPHESVPEIFLVASEVLDRHTLLF